MCNPIARKIIERNKMLEVASQHQEQVGNRMMGEVTDDNHNSSANSAIGDQTERVSSPSETSSNSNSTGIASNDNKEANGDSSMKNDDSDNDQAMDSVREYDVLMGRGSGPNRHSGNIHFRAIVGEVFDEFLSQHGTDRSMLGDNGAGMLRIDPSTKNRLAQAVLDKITLEKKGRFLQKLNKKELMDFIEKGEESTLIKARAVTLMDSIMPTSAAKTGINTEKLGGDKVDSSISNTGQGAVVYYKIIPEKQILAKIKQTFRFLRDQNEQTNAEKHRQRARHVAAVAAAHGVVTRDQPSLSTSTLGGLGGLAALSSSSKMAATYALMERMGGMKNTLNALNINPSPLPDSLSFSNSGNANGNNSMNTSNNGNLWSAARNLNNIMVPTTSSMAMNAIKNISSTNPSPSSTMDYSAMASRILSDLPQSKRIVSPSDAPSSSSLLQSSSLAAAMSQIENNNNGNKITPTIENPAKRLLEELTLSRLANLQKQREDTINAYLAMERSSGGNQGSSGIGNSVPQIDGNQQIQRLFNLNASSPSPLPLPSSGNAGGLGGLKNSTSEPLSLLISQLANKNNGMNNTNVKFPSRSNPLRSFSSAF